MLEHWSRKPGVVSSILSGGRETLLVNAPFFVSRGSELEQHRIWLYSCNLLDRQKRRNFNKFGFFITHLQLKNTGKFESYSTRSIAIIDEW